MRIFLKLEKEKQLNGTATLPPLISSSFIPPPVEIIQHYHNYHYKPLKPRRVITLCEWLRFIFRRRYNSRCYVSGTCRRRLWRQKENNGNLSHHALQTSAEHTLTTNRSHVVDIIFAVKLLKITRPRSTAFTCQIWYCIKFSFLFHPDILYLF